MDKDISAEELQKQITPAMVVAAKKYLEKKEYAERLRPIIFAEKLKIIQEHGFCYGNTEDENSWKPITDPKDDWLMSDADFKKYIAECAQMYDRMGFQVPEDRCPILIADDETRKAKRHMVEVCQPILFGMTWDLLCCKPEFIDPVIDNLIKILIR